MDANFFIISDRSLALLALSRILASAPEDLRTGVYFIRKGGLNHHKKPLTFQEVEGKGFVKLTLADFET